MFMILNSLKRSLETVLAMQALLIIFTETVDEALGAVCQGNYMLYYRFSELRHKGRHSFITKRNFHIGGTIETLKCAQMRNYDRT